MMSALVSDTSGAASTRRQPNFRQRRLSISSDHLPSMASSEAGGLVASSPLGRRAAESSWERRRQRQTLEVSSELDDDTEEGGALHQQGQADSPFSLLVGHHSCHGTEPTRQGTAAKKINQDCGCVCFSSAMIAASRDSSPMPLTTAAGSKGTSDTTSTDRSGSSSGSGSGSGSGGDSGDSGAIKPAAGGDAATGPASAASAAVNAASTSASAEATPRGTPRRPPAAGKEPLEGTHCGAILGGGRGGGKEPLEGTHCGVFFCVLDGPGPLGDLVSQEAMHSLHYELDRALQPLGTAGQPPAPAIGLTPPMVLPYDGKSTVSSSPVRTAPLREPALAAAFITTQERLKAGQTDLLGGSESSHPTGAAPLAAAGAGEGAGAGAGAGAGEGAGAGAGAGGGAAKALHPKSHPGLHGQHPAARSGACAVVAHLDRRLLSVANVGDCRAVVGRKREGSTELEGTRARATG